jgi:hypothetical protein
VYILYARSGDRFEKLRESNYIPSAGIVTYIGVLIVCTNDELGKKNNAHKTKYRSRIHDDVYYYVIIIIVIVIIIVVIIIIIIIII